MQGKRGIVKPPFELPEFIAATGIGALRSAIQEREGGQNQRQKQKEKVQPRMGRMDIDYQVLHDAFFKFQTKPKLTLHGDMYYEGKEFEIQLKEKKPGQLSDDLKRALGMPEGSPPPWLINMQRYGPPPSYPKLRIPGLNAALPEGARWGYHPGGWGKPPVDEFGRPLYGDVFGTAPPEPPPEISQPIERTRWGELGTEVVEEEMEEVAEEGTEGGEQAAEPSEEALAAGLATPSGLTTPSGIETPDSLELRKGAAASRREEEEEEQEKQLYQIMQQQEASVGAAMFGSSYKYVVPGSAGGEKPKAKAGGPQTVDLMKSQKTEKVAIALDPTEVENLEELDEGALKDRYERELQSKQPTREDVSDLMAEHAAKKRKKEQKEQKEKKKQKEFKF